MLIKKFQTIWWPIQRRFGPSWACWVYFLHKSTEFHDMRTDFQRINNYHSFITVLSISHKLPAISWSIAPQSPPVCSPISPRYAESMLSKFFLASEAENLSPTSKISFPDSVTSSVNETSKYWSLKIYQAEFSAPTHESFCLICGF